MGSTRAPRLAWLSYFSNPAKGHKFKFWAPQAKIQKELHSFQVSHCYGPFSHICPITRQFMTAFIPMHKTYPLSEKTKLLHWWYKNVLVLIALGIFFPHRFFPYLHTHVLSLQFKLCQHPTFHSSFILLMLSYFELAYSTCSRERKTGMTVYYS